MILVLFAGIGDICLALTLKKPTKNQCVWLRTLTTNLRKNNAFALPEHLVTLGAWGTAHRQNLYTQTPVIGHVYDMLVLDTSPKNEITHEPYPDKR